MTISKKPKVASSKKPVPMLRNLKKRDPRFDEASGHLNEDLFKKTYSWLSEQHSHEKVLLIKEIEQTKNPELKQHLKKQLMSLDSRDKEMKKREEEKMLLRSIVKQEKKLVEQGKQPFFLKQSEKKKLLLVNKYKKAISNGADIDDLLERRRRHTASRQHKKLPQRRIRDTPTDHASSQ